MKQIITDFYPPDDLPFELAAFYNYAGDLQKSLALYQDLEKRQQNNPGRRPAPKLNIANTFYDLHRYSEALPYYQQALQSYLSGSQQSAAPSQSQMITFIEERIAECKSKM